MYMNSMTPAPIATDIQKSPCRYLAFRDILKNWTYINMGVTMKGQVQVLIKGTRKYKEIGFGPVEGEGSIPFTPPSRIIGHKSSTVGFRRSPSRPRK